MGVLQGCPGSSHSEGLSQTWGVQWKPDKAWLPHVGSSRKTERSGRLGRTEAGQVGENQESRGRGECSQAGRVDGAPCWHGVKDEESGHRTEQ